MAYPVVDITTKKVKDVLYFVDKEIQMQRKLIADLDRETYLKFLESEYNKRMIEEYGDEVGYFGKITASSEIQDQSGKPKLLEADPNIDLKITEILEDQKTMKQIEDEIKNITETQKNVQSKTKNMKAIENITINSKKDFRSEFQNH